jgi:hypothetical protein
MAMIGLTRKRDKRIKELEAEVDRLKKLAAAKSDDGLRKQAKDHHLAEIRSGENAKRFEAKAAVSKEVIREMREAIKVAVVSISDLARRRPNEVTAAHLAELSAQAENLVQFTSLPR